MKKNNAWMNKSKKRRSISLVRMNERVEINELFTKIYIN